MRRQEAKWTKNNHQVDDTGRKSSLSAYQSEGHSTRNFREPWERVRNDAKWRARTFHYEKRTEISSRSTKSATAVSKKRGDKEIPAEPPARESLILKDPGIKLRINLPLT